MVLDAFQLRASGASIRAVREFLREHGIERSWNAVQGMLASRLYIGELHFGGPRPGVASGDRPARPLPARAEAACAARRARRGRSGCWHGWACCAAPTAARA